MIGFIKVTGMPCNSQGHADGKAHQPVSFELNQDSVAVIKGQDVFLKVGTIVKLGDSYYNNLKLDNKT